MTQYLDLDDAMYVLDRFGFVPRDAGLLASALARPAARLAGAPLYGSLELQAAALLESLARNHALIDGNKRTAWTLTALFCWINGFAHDFEVDAAFGLILAVGQGRLAIEASAPIIAAHLVPRGRTRT